LTTEVDVLSSELPFGRTNRLSGTSPRDIFLRNSNPGFGFVDILFVAVVVVRCPFQSQFHSNIQVDNNNMDNTRMMSSHEPLQLPPRPVGHRRRTYREQPVHRRTIRPFPSQPPHHPNHPPSIHQTDSRTTSPGKRKQQQRIAPDDNMIQRISPLQVPTALPKVWICHTAVSTLVDYLIYTRGLFPLTVAELLEPMERTTPPTGLPYSSSSSRTMQRKVKFARDQRIKFIEAWNSDSTSGLLEQASCVLITIGPSYGRGAESYLLDLRGLRKEASAGLHQDIPPTPPSNVLARKLLSKIVETPLSLPRSNSPSFRLFVSLLVMSQDQKPMHCGDATSLGSMLDTDAHCCCWIPRSARVLPTLQELRPKGVGRTPKHQLVVLSLRHGSGSNDDQQGTISLENMTDDKVLDTFDSLSAVDRGRWFCLSQAIKGFRM